MDIDTPNEQKITGTFHDENERKLTDEVTGTLTFNKYYPSKTEINFYDDITPAPGSYEHLILRVDNAELELRSAGVFIGGKSARTSYTIEKLSTSINALSSNHIYRSPGLKRLLYFDLDITVEGVQVRQRWVPETHRKRKWQHYFEVVSPEKLEPDLVHSLFLMLSTITCSKFFCTTYI